MKNNKTNMGKTKGLEEISMPVCKASTWLKVVFLTIITVFFLYLPSMAIRIWHGIDRISLYWVFSDPQKVINVGGVVFAIVAFITSSILLFRRWKYLNVPEQSEDPVYSVLQKINIRFLPKKDRIRIPNLKYGDDDELEKFLRWLMKKFKAGRVKSATFYALITDHFIKAKEEFSVDKNDRETLAAIIEALFINDDVKKFIKLQNGPPPTILHTSPGKFQNLLPAGNLQNSREVVQINHRATRNGNTIRIDRMALYNEDLRSKFGFISRFILTLMVDLKIGNHVDYDKNGERAIEESKIYNKYVIFSIIIVLGSVWLFLSVFASILSVNLFSGFNLVARVVLGVLTFMSFLVPAALAAKTGASHYSRIYIRVKPLGIWYDYEGVTLKKYVSPKRKAKQNGWLFVGLAILLVMVTGYVVVQNKLYEEANAMDVLFVTPEEMYPRITENLEKNLGGFASAYANQESEPIEATGRLIVILSNPVNQQTLNINRRFKNTSTGHITDLQDFSQTQSESHLRIESIANSTTFGFTSNSVTAAGLNHLVPESARKIFDSLGGEDSSPYSQEEIAGKLWEICENVVTLSSLQGRILKEYVSFQEIFKEKGYIEDGVLKIDKADNFEELAEKVQKIEVMIAEYNTLATQTMEAAKFFKFTSTLGIELLDEGSVTQMFEGLPLQTIYIEEVVNQEERGGGVQN